MSQPAESPQTSLGPIVRRVVVVMLLGVVLYGAIVLYQGWSEMGARFATFHWWTFGAACGLAFANYLLRFLKWEYYLAVLDIRGIPKWESFLTFLSGFVLTVTPGKVGEVFKSLVLLKTRGVAFERSAPIVVAERVTDLIGVIAMIAVGSLGFDGGLPWAIAGTVLVLLILIFVSTPRISQPVVDWLGRLPGPLGRLGTRIAAPLTEALTQLRALTTPRRLVWPTLLSFVGWSLEGVGLWVILKGFGLDTPLTLAIFFYATATLAGAIIPLPGGLGVTDKLIEEQLARLGGVPATAATAAMLLIRFATLWFAVAVGFLALAVLRARHPGFKLANDEVWGETAAEGDSPKAAENEEG
ncbi:MAG: flippase-like domain-containing protein [Deltaproteobacteria bacterium]|nr:flippase-like domain-containing protein [Deltaproteobacteria bacterium]